ncbi:MAG: GIY-YIG nuclease family protein [Candidatus Paceibacterota bacterium]
MQYVYVLQSKVDKDFYIGCTHDLKKRLILHNTKKVS